MNMNKMNKCKNVIQCFDVYNKRIPLEALGATRSSAPFKNWKKSFLLVYSLWSKVNYEIHM